MRGSLARTAGVVCLLAAAAVGAGAGALAAEGSGTPGPGAATRDRDALWLGHAWVDGRRTPADAGRLAAGLRDTGIHDLYLHVGPLDDRGNLDPALRPRAVPLVRAIKGALPDARVLAWVGGVVSRGGMDLDRPSVRAGVQDAAVQVLEDGFDGVHYDLEPVRSGNAAFLALLDATWPEVARRGGVLSIAAGQVEPLPGPALVAGAVRAGPGLWSQAYLGAVARRVDQVVVMAYDTALPLASLYSGYVARQTRLALSAVPADTDLLIGLPAFHDENTGHHAQAETVPAAVNGVRLGLSADPGRERFGVALYVDFAATEADWRGYRDGWVRAAGGRSRPASR